jgi:6-phosphogluconolactonase
MLPLAAAAGRLSFAAPAQAVMFAGVQTIGNANKGVLAFHWNADSGSLTEIGLAAPVENPTFIALSPDHTLLFAAQELASFHGAATGAVASFHVGANGMLTAINSQASDGTGTCHVGVDHTGSVLLCANYNGGSASSFKVAKGGALSPAVSTFHYSGHGPQADRQEASHVHRATVSPGNGFALFNDLGLDVIHVYKLNPATAKLTPHTPAAWQAPSGSGPRALRFHPNGKWAYCVLELGAGVVVLDWDEAHGTLTSKQQVSVVPDGFHGVARASEIVIDKSGTFAYAACRDFDCLNTFKVDPGTGRLKFLARSSCGGNIPRDITLDPSQRWLLVANEKSDTIAIFSRDASTGALSAEGRTVPLVKPQCLVFV